MSPSGINIVHTSTQVRSQQLLNCGQITVKSKDVTKSRENLIIKCSV